MVQKFRTTQIKFLENNFFSFKQLLKYYLKSDSIFTPDYLHTNEQILNKCQGSAGS